MSRFIRTMDGGMVNVGDVVLVRPFDDEADSERWEKYRVGPYAIESTDELMVLLLRRDDAYLRCFHFAHESEVRELHLEGEFVPAEPGWALQPVDKEGKPHPMLLPERVIAWAMPHGLPVVAGRGVVEPDASLRLVAPDGTRTRPSLWKPDSTTGRIAEVRWEKPA